MLSLLPIVIAILAVQFNYKTTARTNRFDFAVVLILISVAPLTAAYNDLFRIAGIGGYTIIEGWFGRYGVTMQEFLTIWLAVFAGPFFTKLCRRLADAGMSRHWALLGLVLYLNFPLFIGSNSLMS